MMKPYRLINTFELEQIRLPLQQAVELWSHDYCITPLHLELAPPPKGFSLGQTMGIHQGELLIALIDTDYLSFFNYALFGQDLPEFTPCSVSLFSLLLQNLFHLTTPQIRVTHIEQSTWFYKGSTSLILTLRNEDSSIQFILNPDFVYKQLPKIGIGQHPISALETALEEQKTQLTIDLEIFSISVDQLMRLEKGDVLTTDHPITTPIYLKHNQHPIAAVELGQTSMSKSIQLKRFL